MTFKEKIIIFCCVVLFVGVFLAQDFFVKSKSRIVFCDAGQGDGAFINLHGGMQIVVDGGPDNKMIGCVGKYMPYFDRRIEYLIISHPDKDHFVGAIEILKRYAVNKIIVNGDLGDTAEYKEFLRLAGERAALARDIDFPDGKIDFLDTGYRAANANDNNSRSLVFKFSYAGKNILFAGDAPKEIEENLIKNKIDLRSDILKISHHGSKESSIPEFLKAVAPRLAVISVGADNAFGHPAYRVIKNLENAGIKYLRTDEAGDIVVNLE